MTHAWIDASAGVAGDMLLGALLDAGASLSAVQDAVRAVVEGAVVVSTETVRRGGLRSTKAHVELRDEDPPHRTWSTIQKMLAEAELPPRVRDDATTVFAALAEAEGSVHGVPAADVHFHEVGALDSIADVVGVCAALADLGVTSISAGTVALGSGRVRAAHGSIPVPVPAVVALSTGWRVRSGGESSSEGELTTPTGMALIAALAARSEELPDLEVTGSGYGAGTRDISGRPNVTRVVLGRLAAPVSSREPGVLLEANVDDLDPRLWPGVLDALLQDGANDAWLVPVLMKKGRPGHVLSVLSPLDRADRLEQLIFEATTTLGVRRTDYSRRILDRGWVTVLVEGCDVAVKIGHHDGVVTQVMPEFEDVKRVARALGWTERRTLAATHVVAASLVDSSGPVPPVS